MEIANHFLHLLDFPVSTNTMFSKSSTEILYTIPGLYMDHRHLPKRLLQRLAKQG